MAFEAQNLGIHVSSTGRGGFLTYYSASDAKGTGNGEIGSGGNWQTDLQAPAQAENLRARTAAEDFVAQQAANPGVANAGGVPLFVIGNDSATAGAMYRAKIVETGGAAGRIAPIPW